MNNIDRFIKQQKYYYETAYKEIRKGRKESHWMWFIFPQIKGLGRSEISKYYAIQDIDEAKEYFNNEYLKNNYLNLCYLLLKLKTNNAEDIFGYTDSRKLHSSLTLFFIVSKNDVIKNVLDKYYFKTIDQETLRIINNCIKK
jgi:uncharacterized protein (DUF1810 family)